MTLGSICKRNVVVAPSNEGIVDTAKRMRMLHVGIVVVVQSDYSGKPVPLGILTDRDIVLSIVASDPEHLQSLTVSDAMSDELVTAREDTGLGDAVTLMQDHGIRRLPVVDQTGALVGIVTMDDIVRFIAREMGQLVTLIDREEQVERRHRV
jgi:predicted transcriptional regulator